MTELSLKRPSLPELIWPKWPTDVMGWLDIPLQGALTMRMEEFVDGDTLVLRAELPGIDPEKDVDLSVVDGVLIIKAERREETTEGEAGKSGYRSEFRYGSYERRLMLPNGATPDDVKATYTDGILEVRLPLRTAEPAPRKIEVTRT